MHIREPRDPLLQVRISVCPVPYAGRAEWPWASKLSSHCRNIQRPQRAKHYKAQDRSYFIIIPLDKYKALY